MLRTSASVIIAAKTGKPNFQGTKKFVYDYNILLVKRKEKSSFMPKTFVFPGGIFDNYDDDYKWVDHFKKYNMNWRINISKGNTDNMLLGDAKKRLAVRITAIRETFEETGILICRGNTYNIPNDDLSYWQSAVSKNACKFLEFCEIYQLCPDISSLYEWSNWITPAAYGLRRYNTIFYLFCNNSPMQVKLDDNEVTEYKWVLPCIYLNEKINLPPPQIYELSRLMGFSNLQSLFQYSYNREPEGLQQWLPVAFKAKNGSIAVLPGDELYPGNPESCSHPIKLEHNIEDYHFTGATMNRVEKYSNGLHRTVCNINLANGQITPVKDEHYL